MRDTFGSIHHFIRSHINERGQGMVEYAGLISGIAITLIFITGVLGVVFGDQVRAATCALVDDGARITACGEAVSDRNRPPVALLSVESSPAAECAVNEPCTIRNDSYDPDDLRENLTCEMTITEQATYNTCDNQTVTWNSTGIQQVFLNVTDPRGAVGTAKPLIVSVIDPDGNTPPDGYIEEGPANCELDKVCGPFTVKVVDPDPADTVAIDWSVAGDKGTVDQPAAKTTTIEFTELPDAAKWEVNIELDDDVNAPTTVTYLVGVYDPNDNDDGNDDGGNDDGDDGNDDGNDDDDDAGDGGLTVEAHSGANPPSTSTDRSAFNIKVTNNTGAAVNNVELRLYFTAEGNTNSYNIASFSSARGGTAGTPQAQGGNLGYLPIRINNLPNNAAWTLQGQIGHISQNTNAANDWWAQTIAQGGFADTDYIPVYVNNDATPIAGNVPGLPSAVINNGSYTCEVNTPCTAVAGTSSSPNGGIAQHEWEFTGPSAVTAGNGTNPNPTFLVTGSYQVRYRVTDSTGIQSPWSVTRIVNVTQATKTIFLGDLDATTDVIAGGSEWRANVELFLVDEDGNPVPNLTVRMGYNEPYDSTAACTTGANGRCTIQTPGIGLTDPNNWKYAEQVTVEFSSIDYVPPQYTLDITQSSDADGDSNGQRIIVTAP